MNAGVQRDAEALRAEWRESDRLQARDDLRRLLGEKWGRRIFCRLTLDTLRVYSFMRGADLASLAADAAVRNAGLELVRQANEADPNAAADALRERAERDSARSQDIERLKRNTPAAAGAKRKGTRS